MQIESDDLQELRTAKHLLQDPGFAARIISMLGAPIEKGFALLPDNWNAKVYALTQSALTKAVHAAVLTMKHAPGRKSSNILHKTAVCITGGFGGFLGLATLAAELPISTAIMLRSIADIARQEGEAVNSPETKMACIEVFALGGSRKDDDAAESGYFAVRAALAGSVARAAEHLAEKGLTREGAPVLTRLIIQVAERFSLQVSEKAAAQAIPAIGAAGGALVNGLFISHFQNMARGHFIVRRLERRYGREAVEAAFNNL